MNGTQTRRAAGPHLPLGFEVLTGYHIEEDYVGQQ